MSSGQPGQILTHNSIRKRLTHELPLSV